MGYTLEQVRGMAVGDIMRSEVLAARANWSLETLADFLVDNNISGAPVTTQDDELVGVVSLTDIVRQSSMSNSHSDTGITHDWTVTPPCRKLRKPCSRAAYTAFS